MYQDYSRMILPGLAFRRKRHKPRYPEYLSGAGNPLPGWNGRADHAGFPGDQLQHRKPDARAGRAERKPSGRNEGLPISALPDTGRGYLLCARAVCTAAVR